ncbi:unnamed protein product [Blepharisma stoltei]|uniref:Uncharacterized protein n=1 Tax=Blepharisma stoltei TaxID=1481888 RepID=A0AAU9ILD1_9CILI|nr:unnamed protein product [Blepharisma stoltei]
MARTSPKFPPIIEAPDPWLPRPIKENEPTTRQESDEWFEQSKSVNSTIANLRNEILDYKKENNDLLKKNNKLENEKTELERQVAGLEREIQVLETQLKNQPRPLASDFGSRENKYELEKENLTLKKEIEEKNNKLHNIALNNFALRAKLITWVKTNEIEKQRKVPAEEKPRDIRHEVEFTPDKSQNFKPVPSISQRGKKRNDNRSSLDRMIKDLQYRPVIPKIEVESSNPFNFLAMILISFLAGFFLLRIIPNIPNK